MVCAVGATLISARSWSTRRRFAAAGMTALSFVAVTAPWLAYVTDLIGRIVLFVPKVMVAVLILAFGTYFARFIGMTVTAYCKNLDMPDAPLLGRLAMYVIVVFVAMIAIDHLGLGDIIRQTFLIILIGVALALALAFGLGGQKRAADFLDRWRRSHIDEHDERNLPPPL